MADEQEPLAAGALALGHEMPGASHRGLVHEARLEAEAGELGRVEVSHAPHSRVVLGGARHVHRPSEEGDRRLAACVHAGADGALHGREVVGEGGAGERDREGHGRGAADTRA